jgi:hypothetical protein
MKHRFVVLDPIRNLNFIRIQRQGSLYDSPYLTLCYTWVKVRGEGTNNLLTVPPSGHICGIYARNDGEAGVHKSPANQELKGVKGLERRIAPKIQSILNPLGVNCLRNFPERGIIVWGARTTSSDLQWRYLNTRRFLIYIEESIKVGTRWVIFETHYEVLWERVEQIVTLFLMDLWKAGALVGTRPEEAFFVKCDHTTMTQDDIRDNRLIILVGVASTRLEEFIIFRIAQWRGRFKINE